MSNEHTLQYTNAEKNRPFSGLQYQAQFGLNPALVAEAAGTVIVSALRFVHTERGAMRCNAVRCGALRRLALRGKKTAQHAARCHTATHCIVFGVNELETTF